jgi:hypothetical protein
MLSNIIVRRALRDVGLGAHMQQRKPFFGRKHILTRLRFAQMYENWIIDHWKRVIFNGETKINRLNSYDRPWCWIGDEERVGFQHVH